MGLKKSLKMLFIGCGCFSVPLFFAMGIFLYIGFNSPPVHVAPGSGMSQDHAKDLDSLGLLDPGETVFYYYSDALVDIKDSVYLLTDRRLILHNQAWAKPTWKIEFHRIEGVDLKRYDSVYEDNLVKVLLASGEEVDFPLSNDGDRDLDFIKQLQEFVDSVGTDQ